MTQLNEQKFKRASRPQSGNPEAEKNHKAEIANYEKIVKDLQQKLKNQQELFDSEKQMILADIAAKDAVQSQMEQERSLMQIQIDQHEQ